MYYSLYIKSINLKIKNRYINVILFFLKQTKRTKLNLKCHNLFGRTIVPHR